MTYIIFDDTYKKYECVFEEIQYGRNKTIVELFLKDYVL